MKTMEQMVDECQAGLTAMGLTASEGIQVADIAAKANFDAFKKGGAKRGFLMQKGVAFALAKIITEVDAMVPSLRQ